MGDPFMYDKIIKYRPANGSSGERFTASWCDKCRKFSEKRGCPIYNKTLILDVDDPEYPYEWQETKAGPVCTAFVEKRNTKRPTVLDGQTRITETPVNGVPKKESEIDE